MKNILITGGAGFIGSHVANHFNKKYPEYNIIVADKLTYASNPDYLDDDITLLRGDHGDITNYDSMRMAFEEYEITDVVHLAAESHVDNSIKNPKKYRETLRKNAS